MSKHWIIRRLWQAFQVQDLMELWQTACNLGNNQDAINAIKKHCRIKWNILHTFSTSQISFYHDTASTPVFDPEVTNTQWQL